MRFPANVSLFLAATTLVTVHAFSSNRTNPRAESIISVEDVRPGDVLTFSPEPGDFVSKMITLLTMENVSHAAMAYREPAMILEQAPPQVRVDSLVHPDPPGRFKGRQAFVNRLKTPLLDAEPVLSAGDKYKESGDKYGTTNLYLVGVLLLTRPVGVLLPRYVQVLLTRFFAQITSEIIDKINKGETEMFCSQLVYQVYEDAKREAGDSFDLGLESAVIPLTSAYEQVCSLSSLVDKIYQKVERDGVAPDHGPYAIIPEGYKGKASDEQSAADIAQELYMALTDAEGNLITSSSTAATEEEEVEVASDLALAASDFAVALNAAQQGETSGMLNLTETEMALGALTRLNEALFVTPADLYNRCKNLERIGTIHFDS